MKNKLIKQRSGQRLHYLSSYDSAWEAICDSCQACRLQIDTGMDSSKMDSEKDHAGTQASISRSDPKGDIQRKDTWRQVYEREGGLSKGTQDKQQSRVSKSDDGAQVEMMEAALDIASGHNKNKRLSGVLEGIWGVSRMGE